MVNEELVKEFFRRRFKKEPQDSHGYYEQWVERFRNGSAEALMDSRSKQVYHTLLKERREQSKKSVASDYGKILVARKEEGRELVEGTQLNKSTFELIIWRITGKRAPKYEVVGYEKNPWNDLNRTVYYEGGDLCKAKAVADEVLEQKIEEGYW
jgi:hypothetical protein